MACIFYALVCFSVIYLKIAIAGLGYLLYTYTTQASNPGNFDSDCDYCWLRASNPEVTYHHVSCRHTVISQTYLAILWYLRAVYYST